MIIEWRETGLEAWIQKKEEINAESAWSFKFLNQHPKFCAQLDLFNVWRQEGTSDDAFKVLQDC